MRREKNDTKLASLQSSLEMRKCHWHYLYCGMTGCRGGITHLKQHLASEHTDFAKFPKAHQEIHIMKQELDAKKI